MCRDGDGGAEGLARRRDRAAPSQDGAARRSAAVTPGYCASIACSSGTTCLIPALKKDMQSMGGCCGLELGAT